MVIDVGTDSTEPRLIVESETRAFYLTLSYRWGSIPTLTTTKETLQVRQICIWISDIPQLYRDAVILTRKLDIQDLCIDALCIIQDSKAHWTKESARMSDIFANSVLTIASQSTHDVHEGFARKRIADVSSWTTGILSNQSDTPLPLSFRRSLPFSHDPRLYQKTKHDHDFGVHILDQRAWTLQGALLSSRDLRTNSEQMVWTCDQTFFRESSDEPVFLDNFNSRGPAFAKESNTETNLSRRWRQMIQKYSDREMSYEIDKLPASAHNHNNLSQDKYLAGVWFSDLQPKDLRGHGKHSLLCEAKGPKL